MEFIWIVDLPLWIGRVSNRFSLLTEMCPKYPWSGQTTDLLLVWCCDYFLAVLVVTRTMKTGSAHQMQHRLAKIHQQMMGKMLSYLAKNWKQNFRRFLKFTWNEIISLSTLTSTIKTSNTNDVRSPNKLEQNCILFDIKWCLCNAQIKWLN